MKLRIWAIFLGIMGLLWACREEPEEPFLPSVDAGLPPAKRGPLTQIYLDLVQDSDQAHVGRLGPILDPGAPGWTKAQSAGRSPWRAPKMLNDRSASWLDSIGGSLFFPVGQEGPKLRILELWLKPIAQGQRVSIFLDETPLTTVAVPQNGQVFRIPLPEGGLTPGEHNIRFWFRFSRLKGNVRTSAALSGLRLLPHLLPGDLPDLPMQWVGTFDCAGEAKPALFAGPPTSWSYYLVPPPGSVFRTKLALHSGDPVLFLVTLDEDGASQREMASKTVSLGDLAEIEIDLDAYAGRPVRLNLETRGANGAVGRAAWIEPQIWMPGVTAFEIPVAKNAIVWAVDGLRSDRVGLWRSGEHALTPNLDLIAAEGAAAVDMWSGGVSAEEGHRHLLAPERDGPHLAHVMQDSGRITGIVSASDDVPQALIDDFKTRLDLRQMGELPETSILLSELDDWLDVRGKQPFFLYLATDDPLVPVTENNGYWPLYEQVYWPQHLGDKSVSDEKKRAQLAAYDAQVSVADYWVGQLFGLLETHQLLDDTVVIVVGSVGAELGKHGAAGDGHALLPELLQVPLVVWIPKWKSPSKSHVLRGGGLEDVPRLVLQLSGVEVPESWPGIDLAHALMMGQPIPAHPRSAMSGNQVAARFGQWGLRGLGSRQLRLWNQGEDGTQFHEVTEDCPITLRTLRNYMLDDR